ncbi:MAG: class II D-tagatose-bisphosphate aldolase, non-catalytic subunit [Eubacteriales bacterium]
MHPMKEMIQKRQQGINAGIPSYCTASELVLEVVLERAAKTGIPTLIEATANQVNQFGGYTGMLPDDFYAFVLKIAERVGCKEELIILAGDHLGPLTWVNECEADAMAKSKELVYQYAKAGFTKIHLDTSMKVADDDKDAMLETEVIARRGAILYKATIAGYEELLKVKPEAVRPVFVIGSEVPIPGGAQEEEEGISVTKPEAFADTVDTYKKVFAEEGISEAWEDVIGVVVQPGVEFGDAQVFMYDSEEATDLCAKLKDYPEIVFEGHSTDYQSKECLKAMVEDGIAILKVGPALTFGLREALFALSRIEDELIAEDRSNLIAVLEDVMMANPGNWQKHYHGTDAEQAIARKYSFSDRSRYYMGQPEVVATMNKMFANLGTVEIPLTMIHQYMPLQYNAVRDGALANDARELAKSGVVVFVEDYEYATM